MTHDEIVNLIRVGVPQPGGVWADFGAGHGNFTRALSELLGDEAEIYAIDKSTNAIRALTAMKIASSLHVIQADFTEKIDLPLLDGWIMANALHFVRRQELVLQALTEYLRPGGTLIVIEYDVTVPRPYIPFPVPYARFEHLAQHIGLVNIRKVGSRKSPSTGMFMTAAAAQLPG